jgi:hypothetical protein
MKSSSFLRRWVWSLALLGAFAVSRAEAAVSRGYTGTQIFSTVGADKDPGEPNHCGEPGGASSWFFYKAPRSGVMTVDTHGSSFDTVLAVYIGPGTSFATLTNVACNNDASPGERWSRVVFEATADVTYYIAVDGVAGASGTVKLNYQLGDALTITNQPQALVQTVGASATFIVGAIGLSPLTYQWLYSGVPIQSATQATFTLPSVQASAEGAYSVLLQDSSGTLLSASALLTVCPQRPPTNSVRMDPMLVNGIRCFRVTGNAANGAVLESSEDLLHWLPRSTNFSSQGLFTIDDPMDRPHRYFRIRLVP